jgi:hypothetical protein
MDGALFGIADIALKKLKTPKYFETLYRKIGKFPQHVEPLFGIKHSNGRFITFPVGVSL